MVNFVRAASLGLPEDAWVFVPWSKSANFTVSIVQNSRFHRLVGEHKFQHEEPISDSVDFLPADPPY